MLTIFLSQLRIRIKLAFGRLTTKWRIFWSDLLSENGTQTNCQIIRVGAKLHNFVINSDNLNFVNVPDDDLDVLEVQLLEDGPDGNVGYLPTSPIEMVRSLDMDVDGNARRKLLVDLLKENELTRPDTNIVRNS